VRLFRAGISPNLLENMAMGQNLVSMCNQEAQNAVFGWGKMDLITTNSYTTASQINYQATTGKDRFGSLLQ
jgi:hypothetical protein